ncbi:MAG TPA: alpha/beta hydrolase [Kofleriaceae bacterium]|jgi:pimeloyl-ACP methyl ester carboxylesterase|nr:alpha/beta hydrolase [Kofleriaceae bacterium]
MREIWLDNLYATSTGDGPAVILLHGGLATHAACQPYVDALASRFTLITPDLRGSGRSHDAGPLSWDRLADDVVALARRLGLARFAVGGVSMGSGVAVRVALKYPAAVSALIAIHPAFAGADVGLTPAQAAAMQAMDAAGSRAPAEGVGVLLPLFDAMPPAIRERARAIIADYDPASVAATTRFMLEGGQPFERGTDLDAIDAPALVVPGIDPTHPAEFAEIYRRNIRRCTIGSIDQLAEFLAS